MTMDGVFVGPERDLKVGLGHGCYCWVKFTGEVVDLKAGGTRQDVGRILLGAIAFLCELVDHGLSYGGVTEVLGYSLVVVIPRDSCWHSDGNTVIVTAKTRSLRYVPSDLLFCNLHNGTDVYCYSCK
jgi:hypothetical protein